MALNSAKARSVRDPKPGLADFPRNAWYVAAFSDEVSTSTGLARTLCGNPVFLYRDDAGQPIALYDQCPHRGLPFSSGTLIGEGKVRCGYHGFEFGSDGGCVRVTTTDRIPSALRARSFPLVERWQWIWIWPGDPALADPALIPDHDALRLTAPGWTALPNMAKNWPGNYMLQVENSSDNLHLNFVHEGLVDDGRISAMLPTVEQHGSIVRSTATLNDASAVPIENWWGFNVDPDLPRDRTTITETYCPSLGRIEWTVAPKNSPPETFSSCLAITPETDRTHWVFYATTVNYKPRDPEGIDTFTALNDVLQQDVDCFAAIQDRIDRFGIKGTDVSIGVDERALRARRIIGQMLAAEQPEQ